MNPQSIELRDIRYPSEIDWWPMALGWWLVIILSTRIIYTGMHTHATSNNFAILL